jgi:hypothetical protein
LAMTVPKSSLSFFQKTVVPTTSALDFSPVTTRLPRVCFHGLTKNTDLELSAPSRIRLHLD